MVKNSARRRKAVLAMLVGLVSLACVGLGLPLAQAQDESPAQWGQADPAELAAQGLVRLDGVEGGALLLETDEFGWYVTAPTLHTDIDIAVSGPIARATISQQFRNVATVAVQGKYVFPLPEGAAVDTLRMRVGDRWIQGTIEEAGVAQEIFDEAKAEGQVVSLVEQERPNVFTTSVANIAAGSDVVIQIEYQQTLAPRDGAFGLRVPLVVAPRYDPGNATYDIAPQLTLSGAGWEPLPGLTPVGGPDQAPTGFVTPVEITIDLDAGFPLGDVSSPYHEVDVRDTGATSAQVQVEGPVLGDHDFYLSWTPESLTNTYDATFTEQVQGETHYVTMLTPPAVESLGDTRRPREVIFVQDTSWSMDGDSIVQAKAGLITALERLNPDDLFNIIEFNSLYTVFSADSLRATAPNVRRAIAWVDQLEATAGTEMLPALERALMDDGPSEGRLRQVIFLTDGAVSNELQMLNLIERELGNSRLFTVGIGAAPNSYFMTAAAQAGRGSHVFIGDLAEVSEQMEALFAKVETPAIIDLEIDQLDSRVQVSPFPIPDLYAGDPIVLTIRVPEGVDADALRLTGWGAGQEWTSTVAFDQAAERPGVSKLWAREHIRDLEAQRISPEFAGERQVTIDGDIMAVALEFGLVSRFTSLVAVDLDTERPDWDQDLTEPVDENETIAIELSVEELDRLTAAAAGSGFIVGVPRVEGQPSADGPQVAQGPQSPGLNYAVGGAGWQVQAFVGATLVVASAAALVLVRRREDAV